MKFSTRSRYGLRMMVDLAEHYWERQPVSLSDIAVRQEISIGYLEQLIMPIRRTGLVESVRGVNGGYLLARQPDKITAGEVIRAIEGTLGPTDCVREECPAPCQRMDICATHGLWKQIREAIAKVLDQTTLQDLAEQAKELQKNRDLIMYYI